MARTHKAPGKSHRTGITLLELASMFPDEQSAIDWFEARLWPDGRCCGHCGSVKTSEVPKREADALLVHGLPELLLGQDRDRPRAFKGIRCASGCSRSTSASRT